MSALSAAAQAASQQFERRPTWRLRAGLVVGSLVCGLLGGYLASSGSVSRVLGLAVILLPVAIWKRPYLGPAVLVSAAVLVEQGAQIPAIPLTQKIPLWKGLGPGHLQGADILLVLVTIVYLVKSIEWGPRWWPRSHVTTAIYGVLGSVVLAIAIGHHHGGALRMSLMEARPYIYLAATYFLTSVLVTGRRAIRAMLWGFVCSVGFKALQGIYLWVDHRHDYPKPEAYISHEASYFFVIFIVLVLALWVFRQPGRLRTVATRLMPFVVFAAIVNDRRVAWEMVGGALMCLGVIIYQALPGRRALLGKSIVAILLASAVYFPIMWNSTSSIALPARAIKSQIHPSARDASSDLYRVQENSNLQLNIKQGGLAGRGFGVKIDYALPIADISRIDPLIAYIPHDDVLDVMMRLGLLGAVAMWFLIGAGIIAGTRLARVADRELALVGAVVASSLIAWALMGAEDQGFYLSRLAFITGGLLGLLEAARRMNRASRPRQGGAFALANQTPARLAEPLERSRATLDADDTLFAELRCLTELQASRTPAFIPPRMVLPELVPPQAPAERVAADVAPDAVSAAGPRVARNLLALFGGQVVTWTMTLIWTLVVPRVLGPPGFGVVTEALSVGGLLSIILGLGNRNYLVREIVIDRSNAPRLIGTAIILRLVMVPLVALAAIAFVRLGHYRHEEAIALYLGATASVLIVFNEPMLAMFQAMERMKYMAVSDIINKSAQSLIGIAIALAGLGAVGITANIALVAGVVVVLNVLWLRRHVRIELRTSLEQMGKMARDSFRYWATVVFFTVYLWIDTVMLSLMSTTKVVALYGAATTVFQTLMFVATLMSTAWLPRFVDAFKGGQRQLSETARQPLELVLIISAPMAAGTAMAAHVLVRVLYGTAYAHAVPVVAILGLCLPPTYMNIMLSQVLIAEGKQMVFQWLMVGATIVNPLANLILIRWTQAHYHNGAIGSAIALLLTEMLVAGVALFITRHVFNRRSLRRWMLAALAAGAMWAVAQVAAPLGAPIALSCAVATLVVLVVVLRIPTDDEKRALRGALDRLRDMTVR